ncbi:MAG: tRNA uridine-5-carboxymethylaminomethyl(34) synthesis GTPase MnmE [Thermodesulfovibrionales bacterium]|nr:tRNA uridine-5-carboxymethylaminomethyl(34) synthesis GTPase MnmE [Thermodesulfovibrionales bacterium]
MVDDTIVAISTPLGEGGIGIVRLSGKDSISIADKVFVSSSKKRLSDLRTHSIIHGYIIDPENNTRVDEVLCTVMRSPKTYTREDIVEINCHGGILPLTQVLSLLIKCGARLAEPGEFTKRAFLNGRIDLAQAEAVLDIIRSRTDRANKLAFEQLEGRLSIQLKGVRDKIAKIIAHIEASIDFPEDEIEIDSYEKFIGEIREQKMLLQKLIDSFEEGRLYKEGVVAAIVGKPNVGKSSLLNSLLKKDRAIVTPFPGTTRDIIEDYISIKGLPLRIMDTAGIRESQDLAEREGVKRSLKAIENSDIVIAVFDCSMPLEEIDLEIFNAVKDRRTIIVINKVDIESPQFNLSSLLTGEVSFVKVSALYGLGIEELKDIIYSLCTSGGLKEVDCGLLISNIRHRNSLEKALKSLDEAETLLQSTEPSEIIAVVLREAHSFIGEITGDTINDEIIDKIFSEFCIGK